MAKNKINVYRGISFKIEQELKDLADEAEMRIKPYLRDKLEETYKNNIRDSYTPTGERGLAIQQYNDAHKHQKAANYHHTGTFLNSVHAFIDGDKIKIEIMDKKYDDGTSTRQVYKWLTRGTRKRPKYPYYPVEGADAQDTPWAKYVPTPKHPFNELTISDMNEELDRIKTVLADENSAERKMLIRQYKKKRRKQKLN